MKKNLIALAILGAFSGAALAQSNVTLYGIVDVGYRYNDPESGSSTSGLASGIQSGSRWGIRGSEALSPNLNAVFTLEGGFDIDTGVQGPGSQVGKLFGRQAWAGFSGNWGTAVAGRLATFSSGTGSFDMFGSIDPFATGFGVAGFQSTFTPSGSFRWDNSILYQSPVWGGFRFGAGYSFNTTGGEVAGTGNNTRAWFTGVSFALGPFYAAATYDFVDPPNGGISGSATTPAIFANANDSKFLQIGASFDLKFVKLAAAYAKEDDVQFVVNPPVVSSVAGEDADSWVFGVTVPLFGGQFLASYQKRDGDIANVCLAATPAGATSCFTQVGPVVTPVALTPREGDRKVWSIGYTYPLSRRTNLYATFSDSDGEKFYSNNPSIDLKQYQLGMRHLF
jgi:GBP family porin